MLDCITAATCDTAAVYDLSDAELDAVAAGKHSYTATAYGSFLSSSGQFSLGAIAIGVQVNNQVNVAVLSFGSVQGGSQTNINNSGNLTL